MIDDQTPPRLLSGKAAAAYCSVTPATFSKWVAAGMLPGPVIGRRWDKKALDIALDVASGIGKIGPDATEHVEWTPDRDVSRDDHETSTHREPWQDKFDAAWADWQFRYPPSEETSAEELEKARQGVWRVWKAKYGSRRP